MTALWGTKRRKGHKLRSILLQDLGPSHNQVMLSSTTLYFLVELGCWEERESEEHETPTPISRSPGHIEDLKILLGG